MIVKEGEKAMKLLKYIFTIQLFLLTTIANAQEAGEKMTREQRANETYEALFASKRAGSPTDPEFMNNLQKFIFGEVFYIGKLDNKTRELITVVSLATIQTLTQLKAHINAALNVGNTPLEIREAIINARRLSVFREH